jgi:hypothetical protein
MRPKGCEADWLFGASICLPKMEVLRMLVTWKKDADAALAEAKSSGKPVLVDFSAAPA